MFSTSLMFLYENEEVNFSPFKNPVSDGQAISLMETILTVPFKSFTVNGAYIALTFFNMIWPLISCPSFLSVALNAPVISPAG